MVKIKTKSIFIFLVIFTLFITAIHAQGLVFSDVDVKVGSHTSNGLTDGETIDDEAEPGDSLEFRVEVKNNLTNLNWSLTAGDGQIINSTSPFNPIRPNETVFIYIGYDYGSTGTFNTIASITNGTSSDTKTITLNVLHIQAYNLSLLNQSTNGSIFEFIIKNNLNTNLTNVTWNFDTKNGNIINSTINITLQPNEIIFNYINYNFTSAGAYNVNSTARNGTLSDSRNLTVIV